MIIMRPRHTKEYKSEVIDFKRSLHSGLAEQKKFHKHERGEEAFIRISK